MQVLHQGHEEETLKSPLKVSNSFYKKEQMNDNSPAEINLNIFSIIKYLIVTAIVLLFLNVLVILSFQLDIDFRGKHRFYFDQEMNLPTYFAAFILLLTSSLLSLIAFLKRKEKNFFARHWAILAFIFLLLSVDESVVFHELIIDPLRNKFELTGLLRFSWVIFGGMFVLLFAFSYLKFYLALPKKMKIMFFLSGAIYVLGVLGFEMIGGSLFISTEDTSEKSLPYMIVMTIEETFEMTGILLFIYTLLLYIKSYAPKINLYVK